jgi:hypothetical protein
MFLNILLVIAGGVLICYVLVKGIYSLYAEITDKMPDNIFYIGSKRYKSVWIDGTSYTLPDDSKTRAIDAHINTPEPKKSPYQRRSYRKGDKH